MTKNTSLLRTLLIHSPLSLLLLSGCGDGLKPLQSTGNEFSKESVLDEQLAEDSSIESRVESSGSHIQFEKDKIYTISKSENSTEPTAAINLDNQENVTVDGKGATLILEYPNYFASLKGAKNVILKNFKIKYETPNHVQGKVTSVDLNNNTFTLSVDPGYPMPPVYDNVNWANSASFNSQGTFNRKINIYLSKVRPVGPRSLEITTSDGTAKDLPKVSVGSLFAFRARGEGGKASIHIERSTDVKVQNIEIYSTIKMGLSGKYNEGNLLVEKLKIRREPGSTDILAGLSDGVHLKSNRAQITVRDCYFERMLDDGINLGSMVEVIVKMHSPTVLDLRDTSYGSHSAPLKAGDTIRALNLGDNDENSDLGSATITQVTPLTNRVRRVHLNRSIPGLKALPENISVGKGGNQLQNWEATRLFIPEVANPNFRILSNTFRDKQRSAILAKGSNSLIRGNKIINISGYGIKASNNIIFNEGPIPMNMEISSNSFHGVELLAIQVGLASFNNSENNSYHTHIDVVNNDFITVYIPVDVKKVSGVNISGSTVTSAKYQNRMGSSTATNLAKTSLYKVKGQSGIYYVYEDSYCKYGSMEQLKGVWGDNYTDFLSEGTLLPVGRTYNGNCSNHSGLVKLNSGSVYQLQGKGSNTPVCWWPSMKALGLKTGITSLASLKGVSSLPQGFSDSRVQCR